jgi:hypothetical protein
MDNCQYRPESLTMAESWPFRMYRSAMEELTSARSLVLMASLMRPMWCFLWMVSGSVLTVFPILYHWYHFWLLPPNSPYRYWWGREHHLTHSPYFGCFCALASNCFWGQGTKSYRPRAGIGPRAPPPQFNETKFFCFPKVYRLQKWKVTGKILGWTLWNLPIFKYTSNRHFASRVRKKI